MRKISSRHRGAARAFRAAEALAAGEHHLRLSRTPPHRFPNPPLLSCALMTHTTLIGSPRTRAPLSPTRAWSSSTADSIWRDTGAGEGGVRTRAHPRRGVRAPRPRSVRRKDRRQRASSAADDRWLVATLGAARHRPGVQVVAYDQDTGMFASRLWWLLRWMGHDGVAVLDGGFAKWTDGRLPTSSGNEICAPRFHRDTGCAMVVAAMDSRRPRLIGERAPR